MDLEVQILVGAPRRVQMILVSIPVGVQILLIGAPWKVQILLKGSAEGSPSSAGGWTWEAPESNTGRETSPSGRT